MNATPCWLLTSLLLAASAQAQTDACDQLKDTLAARIEATGVRGYSLESAPAGTPVPSGARVIGTCEAGAYNMLYRHWGAARPVAVAASAAPPVSLPTPAASAVPAPSPEPEQARASDVEPVRVAEPAVTPPAQAQPAPPVVAPPPAAFGFIAEHWPWIVALVLLPIAGWIWAWVARRSAYDEAGLPRGPKIKI